MAILFVLVSSFSAGFLIINNAKSRRDNLSRIIRFIEVVERNAEFLSYSFADIVCQCAEQGEFRKLDFLKIFEKEMQCNHSPPAAWRTAVSDSKMNLMTEEKTLLIRFGEDMCSCSREKIADCAGTAIAGIEEIKESAKENVSKKSKSYAALTVFSGILIVILII